MNLVMSARFIVSRWNFILKLKPIPGILAQLSLFSAFSAVAKLLTVSAIEVVVAEGTLGVSSLLLLEKPKLSLVLPVLVGSFLSLLSLFLVSSSFERRVARYGEVSPAFAPIPESPLMLLSLIVIDLRGI